MKRIGDSEIRSLRLEFDWKNDKLGTIIDFLRVGCLVAIMILFISLICGCKDEPIIDEPNDYDVLVTVVQELQKMVNIVIDNGTTQNNCFESLANIDTSILERISNLEKAVQPANNFVYIMLSEDIEVNGEKQGDLTADKRLDLVRRAFEMMVEQERKYDPNLLYSRFEINSVCIEGLPEPNEKKTILKSIR